MRPAIFLDRDGALIEERHFLSRPEDVRLLPGAAEALRLFRATGWACVLVSNQSGVGRGLFTLEDMHRVHDEMQRQLREAGAELDGAYYCPAAPPGPGEEGDPERKPAPGMLLRAAHDLHLELAASWIVGDSVRDLEAGRCAGCRGGVLVRSGHDVAGAVVQENEVILDDVLAAARWILEYVGER